MMKTLKSLAGSILSKLMPVYWKSYSELSYWKNRKKKEGELSNEHYSFFYTGQFNLTEDDYFNKRVLDIGCGPRGSLEWAHMAKERVGLDPLAKNYLSLGAKNHSMEYVASGSESIPYPDSYFDIVCSFNSLDHVENVEKSIDEIKRITIPGGYFLLIVEINHTPTNCEPHKLNPKIVKEFEPEFTIDSLQVYPQSGKGAYHSIKMPAIPDNPFDFADEGWLTAKFTRS